MLEVKGSSLLASSVVIAFLTTILPVFFIASKRSNDAIKNRK
ncbi:hypothetical protein N7603_08530 [Acholeplasma vituli]|uniref:Uncharacterized protein n=1 Tax=Paracholeplasma vituli TaxID=69473 RepID=A0ABT2PXL5_9MOLU|nr:hypothetical protein [Paracholeplasma vituli]MCU0105701.1 hypothetical protein [Paracholeplasma vituli]